MELDIWAKPKAYFNFNMNVLHCTNSTYFPQSKVNPKVLSSGCSSFKHNITLNENVPNFQKTVNLWDNIWSEDFLFYHKTCFLRKK